MAIGDIYNLQVQGSIQGRKITNNFGFRQTGGADTALMSQVLNSAWNSDLKSLFLDMLSSDYELQCLYTRGTEPGQVVPNELSYVAEVGTRPDQAEPNNSSFVINLVTDSTSSIDNGMLFISGIAETDTLNGDLDPTFVTNNVTPFLNTIINPINAPVPNDQEFHMAVIDRVTSGIPLVPRLSNLVTSAFTSGIIFTQKRRRTKKTGMETSVP